jgi:hypothetical protein
MLWECEEVRVVKIIYSFVTSKFGYYEHPIQSKFIFFIPAQASILKFGWQIFHL